MGAIPDMASFFQAGQTNGRLVTLQFLTICQRRFEARLTQLAPPLRP